ncbi:hypothetical protein H311_02129 [Anncaliia algerae PRA109]|nr:hypothetical protein H311_02129 [Anncaliia algerae PRA109]
MWSSKVRITAIAELLSISKKSVSRFITKMGKKIVNQYYNEQRIIGGPGVIVEIDESKFGKVKYNRGHRVEGV